MASKTDMEKGATVEHNEIAGQKDGPSKDAAIMGTTRLIENELLLVPAPSADPRGGPRKATVAIDCTR